MLVILAAIMLCFSVLYTSAHVIVWVSYFLQDVPEDLKYAIPKDKFTQSLRYGADKFAFGNIESTFMFLEGFLLMVGGWLPYIWDISVSAASATGLVSEDTSDYKAEVYATCVFVLMIALHDIVISTPFSLYRNFVVEEKHGFNKSVSDVSSSFLFFLNVLSIQYL